LEASTYIFGILQPNQVGGFEHDFFSHHIGNVIIPTDELIFFRGVGIPPTRIHANHVYMFLTHIYKWANALVPPTPLFFTGQWLVAVCGFCRFVSDGAVVTWGNPAFGGDSTAVQDQLLSL